MGNKILKSKFFNTTKRYALHATGDIWNQHIEGKGGGEGNAAYQGVVLI